MLVVGVARRLATPLLVARDGAEVGDLDDDRGERARERGRVRVCVPGDGEAAPARVPGPEAWRRPERELAHGGGVTVRCDAARCRVREKTTGRSELGYRKWCMYGARTWLRAPRVVREGRTAGRVLDVAASGALVGEGDAAGYRRDSDELDEEEELVRHRAFGERDCD